jgi:hypothetical protein
MAGSAGGTEPPVSASSGPSDEIAVGPPEGRVALGEGDGSAVEVGVGDGFTVADGDGGMVGPAVGEPDGDGEPDALGDGDALGDAEAGA